MEDIGISLSCHSRITFCHYPGEFTLTLLSLVSSPSQIICLFLWSIPSFWQSKSIRSFLSNVVWELHFWYFECLKISLFHPHRWQIRLSISGKYLNENIFSPSHSSVTITTILPVMHVWDFPSESHLSPYVFGKYALSSFLSTQKLPSWVGNNYVTGVSASPLWVITALLD